MRRDREKFLLRWGVFAVMLVLQMLWLVYWGGQKEGYHMDENYSYALSNCYYMSASPSSRENFYNHWHDKQYWSDYYAVKEGERFAYGSVVYNQSCDVHPPLFYAALHTVSSLFPGKHSLWFGIVINMIFYAVTLVALYQAGHRLFKTWYLALIPCLMYGFSTGAVSTVVFIRMYMLFAMWGVLSLLVSFCILENVLYGEAGLRKQAGLYLLAGLVTAGGFLTQYYYVILQFFISLSICLLFLLRKRWKAMVGYGLSVCAGLVVSVLVYPASIRHILGSQYRGEEAFYNMAHSNFAERARTCYEIIDAQLFHGNFAWIILASGVLFAAGVFLGKRRNKGDKEGPKDRRRSAAASGIVCPGLFVMGIACVGYFCIVNKISPYQTDRYNFPIYPFLCLFVCALLIWGVRWLTRRKWAAGTVAVLLTAVILVAAWQEEAPVNYLFQEQGVIREALTGEYADSNAIAILSKGWNITIYMQYCEYNEQVYCVKEKKLAKRMDDIQKNIDPDKPTVVYIPLDYAQDYEADLQLLAENLGYTHWESIGWDTSGVFVLKQ